MRLKIEILGSLFSDPGKDRSCNKPAVVQLRFARLRIVEHHKTDELGTLSRQIADERDDVFSLFISAFGINFLGGPGLPGNSKTRNGRRGRSAAIADYASKRITDLARCFRRNPWPARCSAGLACR